MTNRSENGTPHLLVFRALAFPILTAVLATAAVRNADVLENVNFVTLGSLGLVSLVLGLQWFGAEGLGIRNGRPVFAGIGFAFVAWVGFLIARFVAVGIGGSGRDLGITILFLLIFEAFCVQLWTFGLLFRTLSDWLNPVSAAIYSGVVFGFAAYLLYGEAQYAFVGSSTTARFAILYFVIWGILYGIIRVRTGSFMGVVLIQAMQTLTAWHMLLPVDPIDMRWLYGIAGLVYVLLIWRLWPKLVSDLRV